MKKFILLLSMIFLVGCGETVPSVNIDVSEKNESSVIEEFQKTTKESFNPVTDIEVSEPDETYYLNNSKIMFSDEKGLYYYVYKSGRDSDYYVLGCETEDKKYFFLENADDFTAYLYKNSTFYGNYRQNKFCSFKDGKYKTLQYEEKNISNVYFTEEFIYFTYKNDNGTEFLRMRYDGSDTEIIAFINLQINKYSVHDNLIFYEADYLKYGVYNTETSVDTPLDNGGAGIFCGDYMYFVSNEHILYRMNTNDFTCVKISENIRRIAVYDGYIIYQPYTEDVSGDGQLYRLGKGENVKIFDAGEILGNDYYYDISVQADKENIFVQINSGPYYRYISEIDIDGNIIEKVYEHSSV